MRNIIFLFVILIISGCRGPFITSKYEPVPASINNKKVIVSRFVRAERQISQTRSSTITTILESAYAQDNSFEIADGLKSLGVAAEAIKDFDNKNLKEDEVLLSGAIILGKKKYYFEDISCGLLIPLVLPMPWNYHSGKDVLFRYEIVDKDGKILCHSGDQNMVVCMKSHYYYIGTMNQGKFPEMNQSATKKVAELVKKSMMQ